MLMSEDLHVIHRPSSSADHSNRTRPRCAIVEALVETNRKLESLSKGKGWGLLAECGRGLSALGCKFPSNVEYPGKKTKKNETYFVGNCFQNKHFCFVISCI